MSHNQIFSISIDGEAIGELEGDGRGEERRKNGEDVEVVVGAVSNWSPELQLFFISQVELQLFSRFGVTMGEGFIS